MTVVSGCVRCGRLVWRGVITQPWRDLAGSAQCRSGREHLGHDHTALDCQACYQAEPPQFR